MESGDEDIFAISDEDVTMLPAPVEANPIEEHLLKQLADVESRIIVAESEITETRAVNARILNALGRRALHGEDASSDSDSGMYTVEGAPVIKKQRCSRSDSPERILELTSQWQCVLQDKWVIGVELYNRSCWNIAISILDRFTWIMSMQALHSRSIRVCICANLATVFSVHDLISCSFGTLLNPRYYPHVSTNEEISGESTFWKLKEERFFRSERIDSIQPGAIVATMVLDLPMFDQELVVMCWGIISYEIDETQFQIPLPLVQLSIVETIDSSCIRFLDESRYRAILALKSTSAIEKICNIRLRNDRDDRDDQNGSGNKLIRFLTARAFTTVCDNVLLVKEHGSLMYCLVEVQSIDVGEANVRIFARSVNQLNIILHLLQDEFPDVSLEETDDCVEAANALIRELEMIRDKKSIYEIQKAKVITDLLIS